MPGTPDPAAVAPVPGAASQAGEGDSGDTALREATAWRRERCRSRGCSGMGSGHRSCFLLNRPHFPSWLWEGSGFGRALGPGMFPEGRGAGCGAEGQDGCTREGAGLSLASSSHENPSPCQPLSRRRRPSEGPALQSPTHRHPCGCHRRGSGIPSPPSSSSRPAGDTRRPSRSEPAAGAELQPAPLPLRLPPPPLPALSN